MEKKLEQLEQQLDIIKSELDIIYEMLPVLERLRSQAEDLLIWGQISYELVKVLDVCYEHRDFLERRVKFLNNRAGRLRVRSLH